MPESKEAAPEALLSRFHQPLASPLASRKELAQHQAVLLVGHSNGEKCVEAVRELLDVLDEFLFGVDGDSLLLPTMLVGAAAAAMAVVGVTGARGR